MSEFSVQWKKLQSQSSSVVHTGKNLKRMEHTVSSVKSNLKFMGKYANVTRALNSIAADLEKQGKQTVSLGETLQKISTVYNNAEQSLLGKNTVITVSSKARDISTEPVKFAWRVDKLLWKSIGKFGVVGTTIAAFGEMVTGGVDYKTLLGGTSKAIGVIGDLAKNAYSDKPDFKKVLFGDTTRGGAVKSLNEWAEKNNISITGKGSTFSASIKKQLSEYSFKACKNVGDKIKVGAKWAGVALSGVTNAISNYKEHNGFTTRAAAETVTETAIDIGIGMAATAGATVLLGATAPAVAVGAVAVGAVWAVDTATKYLTGKFMGEEKGFTELVSDTVLDFGEKVVTEKVKKVKKIGSAIVNAGTSVAKWCTAWT
ncbi:MAG: hypothetical protein J6A92_07885 [Lachnospiraceae bacterium]|nr:hypothetical protein [Lachnospiraceae bacterium]